MKSPFRKLYDFASKHGLKDKISSDPEEDIHQNVAKRMQDVEDMRAQYEGLLTNGQTISGAAYDFSRSLQDMASYMMETFGEIIDQEIGNVFSMLAKVQFEMSKLLDLFAAHVSQTIIIPTEMMMTEIQEVEVIREQYDEKLQLYNRLQLEKQKGKLKKVKGNHSYQQFVLAKEYMKEQVDVLNSRMEALMQGQSQSLITQAAKYHSAQMHLFSKGLASIDAVEPLIRQLAQERNIDRTVSEEELPNNGIWKSMESDGEVEAPKNDGETDGMARSPRHILEPPLYSSESSGELKFVPKRPEGNSKSAPISPSMYFKKEGPVSLESEHERVFMYALPSPSAGAMGTILSQTHTNHGSSHPQPVKGYYSGNVLEAYKSNHNTKASYDINRPLFFEEHGSTHQYTHITDQFVPLQQHANHQKKASTNGKLTTFTELTKNGDLNGLPADKGRRYSHSGPFTDNPLANSSRHAPASNANSMAVHEEDHISRLYKSGPVSRSPMPSYMTRTSHSVSPPPSSPPQISELHKLPLPPLGSMTPPKSPSPTANSAPLARKVQEVPPRSGPASPLPPPPPPCDFVTRSLSIPSSANHIHEWQQEWTSNGAQTTQLTFLSPPLEHTILPVSTGVMY